MSNENDIRSIINNLEQLYLNYSKELNEAWKRTPYEKSIFLSLPFNFYSEHNFIRTIKDHCKGNGYSIVTPYDDGRQLSPYEFENQIINMMSCKYAIVILTKSGGKDEFRFVNPNSILQYGFLFAITSRNTILLVGKSADVPKDVFSRDFGVFDIDNPLDDIIKNIDDWFKFLKKEQYNQYGKELYKELKEKFRLIENENMDKFLMKLFSFKF